MPDLTDPPETPTARRRTAPAAKRSRRNYKADLDALEMAVRMARPVLQGILDDPAAGDNVRIRTLIALDLIGE